jgi:GNAT superfamily N-acetyltransferase
MADRYTEKIGLQPPMSFPHETPPSTRATEDSGALDIRFATVEDAPLILGFIRALAEYERLEDRVVATEESLARSLFGERRAAEVLLAFVNGEAVGFALFFENFSTFRGRRGMYLEDLFVKPAHRGKGYGKAIFRRLASIAVERDYCRLDWAVLDWNEPAIRFYRSLGAIPLDEWTVNRLDGKDLQRLAYQE